MDYYIYDIEEHEKYCGSEKHIYLTAKIWQKPYHINPTTGKHDFTNCKDCLAWLNHLRKDMEKSYARFPFCCDSHKRLITLNIFVRSNYNDCPRISAEKTVFSYQHIINRQENADWEKDIIDYLELVVDSFGSFPESYGAPLLLEQYIDHLLYSLKNNSDVKIEVYSKIEGYFNSLYSSPHKKDNKRKGYDPLDVLISKYNIWLNSFPFDIPAFKEIKTYFEKKLPLMIDNSSIQYNAYTGLSKARMWKEEELVNYLSELTTELLKKVDITQSSSGNMAMEYMNGIAKHVCKIESKELFGEYTKGELKYIDLIKKWLKIQQNYFKDLNNIHLLEQTEKEDKYTDSYNESISRILFFKDTIENKAAYRIFWEKDQLAFNETRIQSCFDLVWAGSLFDKNREVNNGRGPVDFVISKGSDDKTLIEFKLASNSKLKMNLKNQLSIYQKANNNAHGIAVIFIFTAKEENKVQKILKELKLSKNENVIIIDARKDNKQSASTVK